MWGFFWEKKKIRTSFRCMDREREKTLCSRDALNGADSWWDPEKFLQDQRFVKTAAATAEQRNWSLVWCEVAADGWQHRHLRAMPSISWARALRGASRTWGAAGGAQILFRGKFCSRSPRSAASLLCQLEGACFGDGVSPVPSAPGD